MVALILGSRFTGPQTLPFGFWSPVLSQVLALSELNWLWCSEPPPPPPLLETSWLNTILAQLSCCPQEGLSAAPIWLGVLRLWKLQKFSSMFIWWLGTETHSSLLEEKGDCWRNLGQVSQRSEDYTYNTTGLEGNGTEKPLESKKATLFLSLLAFPWIIPQAFSVFPSHSWALTRWKARTRQSRTLVSQNSSSSK